MQQSDDGFAERLREELARRRMSRQALADMARISLSTLEKALSGNRPFTLATVIRIEEALGTSLRGAHGTDIPSAGHDLAPEHMGAYSRAAIRWIEQEYMTLRASFDTPGAVFAYRSRIFWDDDAGHLRFSEGERPDGHYAQSGYVSMPNLSGYIYLITNEAGQYRMMMLGRPTRDARMFGLLSTLQFGAGSQLVPVASPIALVPSEQLHDLEPGLIDTGHDRFATCRGILDHAMANDFCRWRQ